MLSKKKIVILLNEISIYLIHSPRQLVFSNWGDYFMNNPTPTFIFYECGSCERKSKISEKSPLRIVLAMWLPCVIVLNLFGTSRSQISHSFKNARFILYGKSEHLVITPFYLNHTRDLLSCGFQTESFQIRCCYITVDPATPALVV